MIGAPGKVEITLSEERERRIALLRLPVVDVGIELTGFEPEALKRFLTQFDRAFSTRRGVGVRSCRSASRGSERPGALAQLELLDLAVEVFGSGPNTTVRGTLYRAR